MVKQRVATSITAYNTATAMSLGHSCSSPCAYGNDGCFGAIPVRLKKAYRSGASERAHRYITAPAAMRKTPSVDVGSGLNQKRFQAAASDLTSQRAPRA